VDSGRHCNDPEVPAEWLRERGTRSPRGLCGDRCAPAQSGEGDEHEHGPTQQEHEPLSSGPWLSVWAAELRVERQAGEADGPDPHTSERGEQETSPTAVPQESAPEFQ
jgi:hypothetical protein